MSSFIRPPDNVQAIQTSPSTGSMALALADSSTVTTIPGGWIVQHADGHVEAVDDVTFQATYVAVPDPAPAVDPSVAPAQV